MSGYYYAGSRVEVLDTYGKRTVGELISGGPLDGCGLGTIALDDGSRFRTEGLWSPSATRPELSVGQQIYVRTFPGEFPPAEVIDAREDGVTVRFDDGRESVAEWFNVRVAVAR